MAEAAVEFRLYAAAFDIAEAGMQQFSAVGNHATEALDYADVGSMAMEAGFRDEAASCFDKASAAAALSQKSSTLQRYEWEARLAEIEAALETGQLNEARRLFPSLDVPPSDVPKVFAIEFRKELLAGELARQTASLAVAEQHFQNAIRSVQARLDSLKTPAERVGVVEDSSKAVRELLGVLLAQGTDPARVLDVWLEFRAKALAATPADKVPDEGTALVYVALGGRVMAWLKRPKRTIFHWLRASSKEIDRSATQFLDLTSDRDSDLSQIAHSSAVLFEQLVEPFEDELRGGERLTILADGELSKVPFGLLGPDYSALLGDRHVLTMRGSLGQNDAWRPLSRSSQALIVAASRPEPLGGITLPPLLDADAEGHEVLAIFPKSLLLENNEALIKNVRLGAPKAEIFHFAGHGFSDGGHGALVFGGAVVSAHEISEMDWRRCRVAVLSACLTAEGETHGLNDPNSLVRAFLVSGANSVVAAEWSVDSSSTRRLMEAFYNALAQGADVGSALATAQRAVRSIPGFGHPYYWGAFEVFQR